ncbi:sulfatase [Natronomonas sp.]|uniref:sulfatase n=1 Tax=Natronomonas sp. TaxID=2184060 RepID=UPI0026191D83|nr:sulfatase [Natronomonas sp.]
MPRQGGRNVLFVVLDTVRKDHLTPYGHDRPTTPTLEAFAEEAVVYDNAVAQAPWTLPSHASMFTGRYPSDHGATQESPHLPEGATTLAEALSVAGYRSACYSSNAWITPYTRLTAGFDDHDSFFEALPGTVPSAAAAVWRRLADGRLRPLADRLVGLGNAVHERLAASETASRTPAVIDRTRAFIADAEAPWFAFCNLMDAHLPYYPPRPYREAFAPGVDPDAVCQNSKEYNAGARNVSEAEFDAIRRLYDAEISHADAELGRLFGWLRRTGRWDDTVVIVCADHGELHGEFGLYGHEFAVYDPLVAVPLFLKHPDLGAGRVGRTVELLDLYDTVLESAAATGAADRVGGRPFDPERSLLSAGRAIPDGECGFVEYHRPEIERAQLDAKATAAGVEIDPDSRFDSRMGAVRRPDATYVRNERFPDEAYRRGEGGDRTAIGTEGSIARELSAALERFEARTAASPIAARSEGAAGRRSPPDGRSEMNASVRRRLRELGYLE